MQFVRQSKFRHVYCKPLKPEFTLHDVRITKISWDSKFTTVNEKFIAVICEGSGGPFMVFPVNKIGRVEKDYPIVDAHRGPCLDLAWCPFNDAVIASCSEDSTAKVWMIPEKGLRKTLREPVVELLGHQKRVQTVVWHPTAANVLLTAGGDHKILLWNVGTGEALIELAGHPDTIWSVAFNYNGSKIVTTCRDKKIRVIDPRSGAISQQGMGYEGMKPQQAIFTRDGRIFSTGFTKRSERMYALRDEAAIDEPIIQEELDTSNGVLFPLYDVDTGLLYLCGKGDCSIRYYEINNDPPFVHYIETHTAPEPQRGLAFMPKRGLSIHENEISRIYKITNKGNVEVLQFYVPRKSELFQGDLYPDTAGSKPAITADEWMAGNDADPVLVPVNPEAAAQSDGKPKATVKKANILMDLTTAASAESNDQPRETPKAPSSTASAVRTLTAPAAQPARQPHHHQPEPEQKQAPPKMKEFTPPRTREDQSGIGNDEPEEPMIERVDRPQRNQPQKSAQELAEQAAAHMDGTSDQQRRWAERMERLEKMHPDHSAEPTAASARATENNHTPAAWERSRQNSDASNATGISSIRQGEFNLEELLADVHKMKLIIRKHERRIRSLEEMLAELQQKDLEGL